MALRHVVMFRFRPDVTEEQRAAEELRRLPAAIPEIFATTVGSMRGLAGSNWTSPSSATSPRRRTGRPTATIRSIRPSSPTTSGRSWPSAQPR